MQKGELMARQMADFDNNFRVVVKYRPNTLDRSTRTWVENPDAPVTTAVFGPYQRAGYARWYGECYVSSADCSRVSVSVQRAHIEWRDVGDAP